MKATDKQIEDVIHRILNKKFENRSGLVYGFGHAVYTLSDPRAEILRHYCSIVAKEKKMEDIFNFYVRFEKSASKILSEEKNAHMTVYGLSHLGDYEATLFSAHSNNRRFGEDFICHKPFTKLAEGVYTVEALVDLSRMYNVDLPISQTVYEIVKNHKDPKEQLNQLFLRSTKAE